MPELDEVEEEVGRLQIPLGYEGSHYDLRAHIQLIRHVIPSAARLPHSEASDDASPAHGNAPGTRPAPDQPA